MSKSVCSVSGRGLGRDSQRSAGIGLDDTTPESIRNSSGVLDTILLCFVIAPFLGSGHQTGSVTHPKRASR